MTYLPVQSLHNTIALEHNLGASVAYHNQLKDSSMGDAVDLFKTVIAPMRSHMLGMCKPIFRMASTFASPVDGNQVNHVNLVEAVLFYLTSHSLEYKDAKEINSYKAGLDKLFAKVELPPGQVSIYYGTKEDFHKYFMNSDFLNLAVKMQGQIDNQALFNSPILGHAFFNYSIRDAFEEVSLDKGQYLFPSTVADEFYTISGNLVEQFCNMRCWEHAWAYLKYTHNIIELGNFTLITNAPEHVSFADLNDYVLQLEALQPVEALGKDIDDDRDHYLFLMKHVLQATTRISEMFKRRLLTFHEDLLNERVSALELEVEKLSTNKVKEVSVDYGW